MQNDVGLSAGLDKEDEIAGEEDEEVAALVDQRDRSYQHGTTT